MRQPLAVRIGVVSERKSPFAALTGGVATRPFEVACLAFVALKLPFLARAALQGRFVMDEFLQGAFSIVIPDGFYRSYVTVKLVI